MIDLYPQYRQKQENDRRKGNTPVIVERRTGADRRESSRPHFSKTQAELEQIKNQSNFFINQVDKYDKFVKGSSDQQDNSQGAAVAALSTIPYIRRFSGVYEALQHKDAIKAAGKAGIMIINSPEDTRDIGKAFKEAKNFIKGREFIADNAQTPFSFFRGSLLEYPLKKMYESNNRILKRIANKLYKLDMTVYNTGWAGNLLAKLGLKDEILNATGKTDFKGRTIYEYELIGSRSSKFIGRMFLRIPVLGVMFLALLETPAIINAFCQKGDIKDKSKKGLKQILKSSINLCSTVLGGALLGTALSKSKVGSLVGLGLGSYLGSASGKKLSELVDQA